MTKLLNSNFLELPPMSFALYLCVLITFVTSFDDIKELHSKTDFGAKSTTNDVADALFQIAQILRSSQNHSSLYERLAFLEASVTMSQNHNVLAEMRIKELENKVLAMNHKLNASSEVLAKAEALEISTKKLMGNFEEKLSTLATEILRLKSIAVNIEKSLTPSVGHESNFFQQDPREVESNNKAMSSTLTEEKNRIENLKSKSKYPGLREICSLSTSSSLPDRDVQKCWFTLDGKLSNWTTAERFCRFADGKLISDINDGFHIFANLTKENEPIFWMSKSTLTTLFEEENPTKAQINLEENSKSNFPLTDIGRGDKDAGEHVDDLSKLYTENKLSGAIDIRSLPNLDERNGNIEKNFYISNVRISHNDGFLSSVDALNVKRVSKRSPDDFVSLAIPKDAVKFNEFLLLQNSDEAEDSYEQQKITSDLKPKPSSDLLSLLRGMSSNADTSETKTVDETKNCPMLVCSKDAKCVVRVDNCSNLRSFWCQR